MVFKRFLPGAGKLCAALLICLAAVLAVIPGQANITEVVDEQTRAFLVDRVKEILPLANYDVEKADIGKPFRHDEGYALYVNLEDPSLSLYLELDGKGNLLKLEASGDQLLDKWQDSDMEERFQLEDAQYDKYCELARTDELENYRLRMRRFFQLVNPEAFAQVHDLKLVWEDFFWDRIMLVYNEDPVNEGYVHLELQIEPVWRVYFFTVYGNG